MSEPSSNGGGIGIIGLLGVLFVGLKLGGIIDWSWWWVTFPFWGGLAIFGTLLFGAGILAAVGFGILGIVNIFKKK